MGLATGSVGLATGSEGLATGSVTAGSAGLGSRFSRTGKQAQ